MRIPKWKNGSSPLRDNAKKTRRILMTLAILDSFLTLLSTCVRLNSLLLSFVIVGDLLEIEGTPNASE